MGAAVAAIPPATGVGATVAALRLSIRDGFDATLPTWLDWFLASAGVTVEVVAGKEHLKAPRPAVFIFNHKNNWDPMCLASLVRTRFTGVAKKELERDPILGTFGRLLDIAFVDRSGKVSAADQLKGVEELGRKGLSIIVSPEGTRSKTGELGPFKKGAFRIAMATGLPVIPVVFRNSEVLGDADSKTMGSGHVEVRVLPPVYTDGWTLEDLDQRIEEVRDSFVDTLAHWPGRLAAADR